MLDANILIVCIYFRQPTLFIQPWSEVETIADRPRYFEEMPCMVDSPMLGVSPVVEGA